jgi:predicted MFS family arabinose efflux permease
MKKNRIAVNIAFFINGFIFSNWISRQPRIMELFKASEKDISIVLLSFALGAVLAMPFTGWIIVKNGSRRMTLISIVLYCAFVPLITFFDYWANVIPLFFVMGIVTGILDVAMNAQAVIVEQQYKRPIMTSFHAYFSVGMALGSLCGSFFSSTPLSLFQHFSIVAFVSLIAIIWLSQNLVHDKPTPDAIPEGPLFRLPNAALLSVGIIAFCCMMGEGAMADWSVIYMEKIANSSKSLAPIALFSFATAMTLGRIIGDGVRARVGDGKIILGGGILASIGLVSILLFAFPFIVITGCFLVGLGLSAIVPVTYSIAGNAKGLASGVGIAMVTTVGYTGFLIGPPIIGFIAESYSLRMALYVVAVLFLIMTVLGFFRKSTHN